MILEIINLLILTGSVLLLLKIIFHFQKLTKKAIVLFYLAFILTGLSALIITYILALSGALPNHYMSEFDTKIINDVSLFIGVVSIVLSATGPTILLSKQILGRAKKI